MPFDFPVPNLAERYAGKDLRRQFVKDERCNESNGGPVCNGAFPAYGGEDSSVKTQDGELSEGDS